MSSVVDLVRKSWNTFAEMFREWATSLSGPAGAKKWKLAA